jgi:hypothetical protein
MGGSDDNTLRSSIVHDSYTAIIVHGATAVTENPERNIIEHCTISNTTTGSLVVLQYDIDTTLRYNTFTGVSAQYGISGLTGSTRPVLAYNIFNQAQFAQENIMYNGSIADPKIQNNTFTGANVKYAIKFATNVTNAVVQNNIGSGVWSMYNIDANSRSGLVCDYNDIYNVTYVGLWDSLRTTLTQWKTASSQDAHSINGNPLFVSTTDFRLTSVSPAINTGTNISLTSDFLGTVVPQGVAPDMGYLPSGWK